MTNDNQRSKLVPKKNGGYSNKSTPQEKRCWRSRRYGVGKVAVLEVIFVRSSHIQKVAIPNIQIRSHPTNAKRCNHFSTSFQVVFVQIIKHTKNFFIYIIFPWKGTLTDAGDGDEEGATNHTTNSQNHVFLNPPRREL